MLKLGEALGLIQQFVWKRDRKAAAALEIDTENGHTAWDAPLSLRSRSGRRLCYWPCSHRA